MLHTDLLAFHAAKQLTNSKFALPPADACKYCNLFGFYFDHSGLNLPNVTRPEFHIHWSYSDEKRQETRALLYADVCKFQI
jgi:hypothetical protein